MVTILNTPSAPKKNDDINLITFAFVFASNLI